MPAGRSMPESTPFWSEPVEALLGRQRSSGTGLDDAEAARRLAAIGPNLLPDAAPRGGVRRLASQMRSPIAGLLLASAILSLALGETVDASIILGILVGSALLGIWQERQAAAAVASLLALVRTRTRVLRAARELTVPSADLVPGDIVLLSAGDLVAADCRVLEAGAAQVDESTLTGESMPVAKSPDPVAADAPLGERSAAVFAGTHVVSGTLRALVMATGGSTMYGGLARDLEQAPPESGFERGVRRFGYLLLEITTILVLVIFAANVALDRPILDAFLFALALAVGLTPQLLPAIVSVTLAHGARRMAERQVIVRRLVAIENLGGMTVLCSDKTGTLTAGTVGVHSTIGADGEPDGEVRRMASLNASFQAGFRNPVDRAILEAGPVDTSAFRKLDEIPYDFSRRRLSVLLQRQDSEPVLITKGALAEVLDACESVQQRDGTLAPLSRWRPRVEKLQQRLGDQGLRCLGVAHRELPGRGSAEPADETGMVLAGLVALHDPVKEDAASSLERLRELGVRATMITGDNRHVAATVATQVGLNADRMLTGTEVRALTDAALRRRVARTDVFAEIDPNQKQRIISALRRAGASVGYLGDGINDAGALHAADVGISVDSAVEVTRQAAAIVLLRKDLGVLAEGIEEGRRAFANTLKYVFVTLSASFGNMLSMAIVSLATPFLPMLPKQILLLNLVTDLPAMAIATDRLDPELVARPRRWNLPVIRRFMLVFGALSSVFDLLAFLVLMLMSAPAVQFRSAWFVESALTEVFVLLVIRTQRVFFRSRPSRPLLVASWAVAALALALPYGPLAPWLGFAPLSPALLLAMLGIVVLLLVASEAAKRLGSVGLVDVPRRGRRTVRVRRRVVRE